MQGTSGKWSWTAVICLVAMGAAGCAEFGDLPAWVPFQGKLSDDLPGVIPPGRRVATYRRLADEVAWKKPAEKKRIAEYLASSIRTEEDPMIRVEIIHALSNYPGPEADAVLKAAVSDPEADVRLAACNAWAKRGGREGTALMTALLSGDADPDVRLAAARALGQGRDPAAVAALGKALEDPDPAMQYRAVVSLKEVTGKDFGNDVSRWQQYVKGETPQPAKPVSIADRLLHLF